jgi:hypothetical protein
MKFKTSLSENLFDEAYGAEYIRQKSAGTNPTVCSRCNGTGSGVTQKGRTSASGRVGPTYQGPCPLCGGSGVQPTPRAIGPKSRWATFGSDSG